MPLPSTTSRKTEQIAHGQENRTRPDRAEFARRFILDVVSGRAIPAKIVSISACTADNLSAPLAGTRALVGSVDDCMRKLPDDSYVVQINRSVAIVPRFPILALERSAMADKAGVRNVAVPDVIRCNVFINAAHTRGIEWPSRAGPLSSRRLGITPIGVGRSA